MTTDGNDSQLEQPELSDQPEQPEQPSPTSDPSIASDPKDHHKTLVGIGASAGGLAALKTLFSQMPADTGLPFVIVVHLSADHESHLAELLQPHTSMPVRQVTENTALEPNHVYVIPPNANLESVDTHLRLSQLERKPRQRTPIDHFFRTMTTTHDGNSIGIVLTGSGSDGTLGLRRIREAGGLTIAQSPDEAPYNSMPLSAIGNGVVDLVLTLEEMPSHILRFVGTNPRVSIGEGPPLVEDDSRILQKIFVQIRSHSGHDFSRYKHSTVMRRIRRRMQIQHAETLGDYLEKLRSNANEAAYLIDDLLITVTEFFRDPDVFAHLSEEVIPSLFRENQDAERIRVWSVGCSTGEEAYSLAILLLEQAAALDSKPQLQVFASDLHERSLHKARDGVYPESIAADISPERLKKFFIQQSGSYRIRQEVRDTVVFAPHNLLKDPPFSHLDLIVCRNVLIYLQRDIQQDVIALFHYALDPNGLLVLGTAETIDPAELFIPESKTHSVYRRRNVPNRGPRMPSYPFRVATQIIQDVSIDEKPRNLVSFGDIHANLVERYAPPSVLVNQNHEIVHYSALAGKYLQLPGGQPTNNLFKLLAEPLRVDLRLALHRVREDGLPTRSQPISVNINGRPQRVVLRIRPIAETDLKGYFLIIFDDEEPPILQEGDTPQSEATARNNEIEQELEINKLRLQTVIDEFESSQEEMQASNEELQSTNEELRSTLEELETSKEELQSMNEELATVNQENRHRVEELSQLSGYLQNLLAATDIATVFLDRELRILRFTPKVGELFNVRDTDHGRPLSDITHRFADSQLQNDANSVLKNLTPIERELSTNDGHWLLARTLPYRTPEDRIAGIVITLIDISRRKQAEDSLQNARDVLEQRIIERTAELENHKLRRQELAQKLASAEHSERKRLAAILHDDLQQHLVAAKMQIATAKQADDPTIKNEVCERVLALIDQAITSSRNLTQQLRPPVLYEDGLVPALRWLADETYKRHGVTVHVNTTVGQTPLNEDIRAMLFDSVRELLFNAVKHAGVPDITLNVHSGNNRLRIEVVDHGAGFDLHAEEETDHTATGLGLFGVRERIEMVGGTTRIESALGDGTRITLELPLAPAPQSDDDPTTAISSPPAVTTGQSHRPADPAIRVLIADDHAVLREGIIRVLVDDTRIRVVAAVADGVKAITAVEEFQPDVILMDVNMPRLNGIEATRHIHSYWPDIHIIGLSVQDDIATRESMVQAGASAFVSKSNHADSIVSTILDICRDPANQ